MDLMNIPDEDESSVLEANFSSNEQSKKTVPV
jgi:hypothetical protein